MPLTNPIDRSISPSSSAKTSPIASSMYTAPWMSRLTRLPRGQEVRVERLEQDRDQEEPADDGQHAALAGRTRAHRRHAGTRAAIRPRSTPASRARRRGRRPRSARPRARAVLVRRPWSRSALHRRLLRRAGDAVDRPVVIRSTTICGSISAAGRTATMCPRRSTAMRSATSNTSFMLCETISTASPRSARRRTSVEHHRRLRHAERGGRLVHDHELRVPQHRLGDRDRLALAARERRDELADRAHGGHGEARQRLARPPSPSRPRRGRCRCMRLAAEEHVLDDVEVVARARGPGARSRCRARPRRAACGCAPACPPRGSRRSRGCGSRRCT